MIRAVLVPGILCILSIVGLPGSPAAEPPVRQGDEIQVPRIEEMPLSPGDCVFPDWNELARGYADLAFDLEARGPYLPLIWIDSTQINFPEDAFGMYVTLGDPRGGPAVAGGTYHIASGSMGAVLGSTLAGIDMRSYKGRDWVRMCRAYFNRANGRNVFMEHVRQFDARKIGGCYGIDFWGDVLPSLLAMELGTAIRRKRRSTAPCGSPPTGSPRPRAFSWPRPRNSRGAPSTSRR